MFPVHGRAVDPYAIEARQGGYSAVPIAPVTILEGIRERVGPAAEVVFAPGPGRLDERTDVVPGACLRSDGESPDGSGLAGRYWANIDLSGAEVELVNAVGRETLLRDAIEPYLKQRPCDYVIYDCPPSLGILSLNALAAAREVLPAGPLSSPSNSANTWVI